MGQIWKEHWAKNELGSKEPDEIQREYVKFCRKYRNQCSLLGAD